jgi:hypothetical protein
VYAVVTAVDSIATTLLPPAVSAADATVASGEATTAALVEDEDEDETEDEAAASPM